MPIMKQNRSKNTAKTRIPKTQNSHQKKADPFTTLTIVLIFAVAGYLWYQVLRSMGVIDLSSAKDL